jgi:hypothetical protein
MILHLSMPADDCAAVARGLAEIMEGGCLRFPPGGPEAWNVWSRDAAIQIVVTPRSNCMVPGEHEMVWTTRATPERFSETHFALCVDRAAQDVLAVAKRAGWPARICERSGFFHVVELWVEGVYLVEVLDPVFSAEYRRTMTVENWKARFGA